jgi:hypothetical protein
LKKQTITAGTKAPGKAKFLGLSTGVAGQLPGLIRKSYKINGDMERFEAYRQKLEAYAELND